MDVIKELKFLRKNQKIIYFFLGGGGSGWGGGRGVRVDVNGEVKFFFEKKKCGGRGRFWRGKGICERESEVL